MALTYVKVVTVFMFVMFCDVVILLHPGEISELRKGREDGREERDATRHPLLPLRV